ncbi:MAG: hypothetical protein WKF41_09565 [Gaiellaceae bacterium]|jgi:type IV secretory pathway TrbD component
MMTSSQFAAALGFAFVAVWIAMGFGSAVLCLAGAAVFYAVVLLVRGDVDLAEVQSRLGGRGGRASTQR